MDTLAGRDSAFDMTTYDPLPSIVPKRRFLGRPKPGAGQPRMTNWVEIDPMKEKGR